jgi:hypothetical protein
MWRAPSYKARSEAWLQGSLAGLSIAGFKAGEAFRRRRPPFQSCADEDEEDEEEDEEDDEEDDEEEDEEDDEEEDEKGDEEEDEEEGDDEEDKDKGPDGEKEQHEDADKRQGTKNSSECEGDQVENSNECEGDQAKTKAAVEDREDVEDKAPGLEGAVAGKKSEAAKTPESQ